MSLLFARLTCMARWRVIGLRQWIFEEFRVVVAESALSRELRAMGYRKLWARPRHYAQAEGAIEDFKKPVAGRRPPVAVETAVPRALDDRHCSRLN